MTSVLVTGAAGFVGHHLLSACAAAGWAVTAADRRRISIVPPSLADVERVHGDVREGRLLARVTRGEFDVVLHQAAITDTLEDRWDLLYAVNVAGPVAVARACAASGTRFVYASSGSVYGAVHRLEPVPERAVDDRSWCTGPLNAYARSKLRLEHEVAAISGGLAWVGLRYTNVFGVGEGHKGRMASVLSQLLRQARAGERLQLFSDTLLAARDYLPVEILVDVVTRLVGAPVPSGVYNLGSGCAIPFATVLQWCAEFAGGRGVTVDLIPNPIQDRYQRWTCADMTALHAVVPSASPVTADDVRAAAAVLYGALDPATRHEVREQHEETVHAHL